MPCTLSEAHPFEQLQGPSLSVSCPWQYTKHGYFDVFLGRERWQQMERLEHKPDARGTQFCPVADGRRLDTFEE